MTTIVFPTLTVKPSRIEWQLLSSSLGVQSPLDLSIQQQEFIGARWGMILEYNTFTEGDANALKAFLAKMRGGANVVELYNFERPKPQGVTIGAPTIKVVGAGQTGTTLNTNGWATGSHVKMGDFFAVNGELKMIVTDAAGVLRAEFSISELIGERMFYETAELGPDGALYVLSTDSAPDGAGGSNEGNYLVRIEVTG